jgi:hypothetical protein
MQTTQIPAGSILLPLNDEGKLDETSRVRYMTVCDDSQGDVIDSTTFPDFMAVKFEDGEYYMMGATKLGRDFIASSVRS